ncbi:MAG: DUF302 domain-containing protein [Nitrososphaerota archaeon]|nr:DUF302 domain-containing protein [Nitrososphaerota archaeon]MDG6940456.1 DUF302 domain-containing protein [Nitrososphaerota archaeon]MDG6962347.1 DUF302 domain-containing protein [Nitrososphaerota archaeon]MDG6971507.1 DUF302 domain-containing protein [Nitrososphaerota archaeon]MDG6992670.1 DUF302 domain-containing protein [Nitrososphaerota archaeon]
MSMTSIAFVRRVEFGHEEAVLRLKETLKANGWGVLTDIDLKATLKERTGVDVEKYNILDVCNPKLAAEGLTASKEAGLVLPCKIVVYDEGQETYISLYLPTKQLPEELRKAVALQKVAEEAEVSLKALVQGV